MEIDKVKAGLHPLERKVLPFLASFSALVDIIKESGLKDVEVMRAVQWLSNKEVLILHEEVKEFIELGSNGKAYKESGLPEKRFLKALLESPKKDSEIRKIIDPDEFGFCMGILKKNSTIIIDKGEKGLQFTITPTGKQFLKRTMEEDFLNKSFPIEKKDLTKEDQIIFDTLKNRKDVLSIKTVKFKSIELTDFGKKLVAEGIDDNFAESLTPDMLRSGKWKDKVFRRYDVGVQVPSIFGGKKQNYRRFLDEVRQKFLSLGFTEMDGPIVESDFWDMDALFMPQFHSARDIHQAYYIKDPEYCDLDPKIVKSVKAAHEHGGNTGSKGWRYNFDVKRTARNVLRTQGTACSARMLASKDLKNPSKYFGMTRCFRYDVIDATHLPDFNQVEGIIVEEGLTLRHLFGLLKMFAKEFADTEEIRLVPAYFPFTEPSVELFAKHPDLGWIELGGAGIFRPELTNALGVNTPVLAWGMGIDRIAMFKLGIKDIRHLFSHDLKVLRESKVNI